MHSTGRKKNNLTLIMMIGDHCNEFLKYSLVDDFKNPPKTTQICEGVQPSPYSGYICGRA